MSSETWRLLGVASILIISRSAGGWGTTEGQRGAHMVAVKNESSGGGRGTQVPGSEKEACPEVVWQQRGSH